MGEVDLHDSFQPMTPGRQTLVPDEVHIWAVPLVGDADAALECLSPAEREQAGRFRVVDHRRRYAISHAALRAILAGYTGADPLQLQFQLGPRGKPELGGHDGLRFNLSHSAQLAMVAVASHRIGIDVEKMRHLERLRDIARRQFSEYEYAALDGLADGDRLLAFYRCWTRKEAYVKALGLGLTALDVFDVEVGDRARFVAFRDGEDLARWAMFDVSPGPGYIGALVVDTPRAMLRQFRFGDL